VGCYPSFVSLPCPRHKEDGFEKELCGKEFMDETRKRTSRDTLEYCG